METFLSCLPEEETEISDILDQIVPMKLTKFEEKTVLGGYDLSYL